MCPHVLAVEYFPNGDIKRVEFRKEATPAPQQVTATPLISNEKPRPGIMEDDE